MFGNEQGCIFISTLNRVPGGPDQYDAAQWRPLWNAPEEQFLEDGVHGSDADAAGHEDEALARGRVGRAAVGAVQGEADAALAAPEDRLLGPNSIAKLDRYLTWTNQSPAVQNN